MRITVFKSRRLLTGLLLISVALVSLSKFNSCHIPTQQEDFQLSHLQKRNYESLPPSEGKKQVVDTMKKLHRRTKGFQEGSSFDKNSVLKDGSANMNQFRLSQSDIFISLKTTKSNHNSRLKLLLETWVEQAKDEVCSLNANKAKYKYICVHIQMYTT